MTQENISDDWVDLYNNSFRRDAHQLLAWGYEDARSRINADNEETDITGFIAEKIDNRLDDPNTPDDDLYSTYRSLRDYDERSLDYGYLEDLTGEEFYNYF